MKYLLESIPSDKEEHTRQDLLAFRQIEFDDDDGNLISQSTRRKQNVKKNNEI